LERKVSKALLEKLALKGLKAKLGQSELLGLKAHKVSKVFRDWLARLVHKAPLELLELEQLSLPIPHRLAPW
jgi:hypothetical protein